MGFSYPFDLKFFSSSVNLDILNPQKLSPTLVLFLSLGRNQFMVILALSEGLVKTVGSIP